MRAVSHHTLGANALLMDGVTRLDEMRFFTQKIPSSEHVPIRASGRSGVPEDFAAVYAAIDGHANVEELGRVTGLGEFELTRALYALVQSHHVVIHPPRVSGGPTAIVAAASEALRSIFEVANAAGKTSEVRDSLASFAVGAGVYEILFRGAGPNVEGVLDADRVVANVLLVESGSDRDV